MKLENYTIEQTLTPEAVSLLKHSLLLATTRGHAQITPLHLIVSILTNQKSTLFKKACLKSKTQNTSSFSIQSSELEFCFNSALNRLPITPCGYGSVVPSNRLSLSNSLIAALKRALANQRKGFVEHYQHQQSLFPVQVELGQLIVSILDDPSVSRVMREAGFSSTEVKSTIESYSVSSVFNSACARVFSSPSSPSTEVKRNHHIITESDLVLKTHVLNHSFEKNLCLKNNIECSSVSSVRVLSSSNETQKGRCQAIINHRDMLQNNILNQYSEGKQVLFSRNYFDKYVNLVIEVLLRENNKNTVIVGDSVSTNEGIVAELVGKIERGDVPEELKQTQLIRFHSLSPAELRKDGAERKNTSELKRIVDCITTCGNGVIVYLGDLKCFVNEVELVAEIGRLVFEQKTTKVWFLGTACYETYMRCQMKEPPLDVQWSLRAVCVPSGVLASRSALDSRTQKVLDSKKEEESNKLSCCAECTSHYETEAKASNIEHENMLALWLKPNEDIANRKEDLARLRRKWNIFCRTVHQERDTRNWLNSTSHNGKSCLDSLSDPRWSKQSKIFPNQASGSSKLKASILKQTCVTHSVAKFRRKSSCTNSGNGIHNHQPGEPRLDSFKKNEDKESTITLALGHSPSSDSKKSEKDGKTMLISNLWKKLRENLAWQSKNISSVVPKLMESISNETDSWILIEGSDVLAKARFSRIVAECVFGTTDFLFELKTSEPESEENSYSQTLIKLLMKTDKLVVLVEEGGSFDPELMRLLSVGFQTGNFGELNLRERNNGRVIFILTTVDSSRSSAAPSLEQKRKSEWELSEKMKKPRVDKNDDVSNDVSETMCDKKDNFSSESPSLTSTLDLNMKSDEDYESEAKISNEFLDLIQNRFVFDQPESQKRTIKDSFLYKISE